MNEWDGALSEWVSSIVVIRSQVRNHSAGRSSFVRRVSDAVVESHRWNPSRSPRTRPVPSRSSPRLAECVRQPLARRRRVGRIASPKWRRHGVGQSAHHWSEWNLEKKSQMLCEWMEWMQEWIHALFPDHRPRNSIEVHPRWKWREGRVSLSFFICFLLSCFVSVFLCFCLFCV